MGTFSRRQLPTAKRTGKRQGRLRRHGVNRDGRRACKRLGPFGCDGQKRKRAGPFGLALFRLGSLEASPVGASTLYHTFQLLSTIFWWQSVFSLAAASVLPAGVPSRCAPAHGRAGGGLLLALLPYRSQRCAQRAAWPSFGRAVSVHAGGPRGRCAFGAGGLSAA